MLAINCASNVQLMCPEVTGNEGNHLGWWPESDGEGTLTMTKPSSSIELPMLLDPRPACTHNQVNLTVFGTNSALKEKKSLRR